MNLIRTARPAHSLWNICKTVAALALWGYGAVWLGSAAMVWIQNNSEVFYVLNFPPQRELGWILAGCGTFLIVWSALTMAVRGRGTFLTFDGPQLLVIGGPYAWLRNPMMLGTLLQGVGLGLHAGAAMVIICFALGVLWWELFWRGGEETAMQKQHGRAFELYQRSVNAWVPHVKPWRKPKRTAPISYGELRGGKKKR